MMKRGIDLIVSVLLVGLTLPLLLLGWLALKCRRAEPVLVRGHGTPENPAGLLLFNSSGSDLFSAFLRRTSTDHLPVLFDVVAGKARLKDTVQWPQRPLSHRDLVLRLLVAAGATMAIGGLAIRTLYP